MAEPNNYIYVSSLYFLARSDLCFLEQEYSCSLNDICQNHYQSITAFNGELLFLQLMTRGLIAQNPFCAITKKRGFCALSCYCKKEVLCNKHFHQWPREAYTVRWPRNDEYQYGQKQQEWICFVHFFCSGNLWHIFPLINMIGVLDLMKKWYMFDTFFLLLKQSRNKQKTASKSLRGLSFPSMWYKWKLSSSENIMRRNCKQWQFGWFILPINIIQSVAWSSQTYD